MRIAIGTFLGVVALAAAAAAAEFHVAANGNDSNPGTRASPLRTIQRAADLAQPGDAITVHEGVYRERISPPRGGESDAKRIVYQAAPGEKVEIKGSEIVKNWVKVQDDVWKVTIPNAFFGKFNPYSDLIHGDWFNPLGRQHHTGAVYLDGDWLTEAAKLDDVLKLATAAPLWFGKVDKDATTIWAQFKGVNPNEKLVEINVRQTVFYPKKPGMNYITVRGFAMRHAATPWAPPTAEQMGLIGTHWSKGWIIENNTISHSVCSGVALGKYGDEWDNRAESAEGYVGTIHRALKNGWNKETVGGHVVRNNTISHCEQTGIVGSLGCAFSVISGNTIHDIHVRRLFSGAEMAGIKFHGGIDVVIRGNHIYRVGSLGIWLDWMGQGARVSGNLLHDNADSDVFFEVDHGPILVDNNILLSPSTWRDYTSQGIAFAHNLIAGSFNGGDYDGRQTPFHKAHSTALAGMHDNPSGDDRFYNNLVAGRGNWNLYDAPRLPVWMDGNVFFKGSTPSKREKNPLVKSEFDPTVKLVEKADGYYLEMRFGEAWAKDRPRKIVTTDLLGKAAIPNLPYEQPDGKPIRINADYFGKARNESNPTPGPFENPGQGKLALKVW